VQPINRPIIILHELDSGKAQCIIAGKEEWPVGIWGLHIADIIGHTAKALGVEKAEVVRWVNKELGIPTTDLVQTNLN